MQRHQEGYIFLKLCLGRQTLWPVVVDLITKAAIGFALPNVIWRPNPLCIHPAGIKASIYWKIETSLRENN